MSHAAWNKAKSSPPSGNKMPGVEGARIMLELPGVMAFDEVRRPFEREVQGTARVPPPSARIPLELLEGSDHAVGERLRVTGEGDELLQLGLQPGHPGLFGHQRCPRRLRHRDETRGAWESQ